jgi:D-serine deaminase-like pyridoxal phosphate-dependent protein
VKITDAKTPCGLVDLDRMERNARRMSDHAHRLGVRLRPHVKTHKCAEVARLQVAGHFGGITVSTLAEARGFARAGFQNISYAVPVPLDRLDECVELQRDLESFHLLLDHPTTLRALEQSAPSHALRWSVFLKVDSGGHRAGVDPHGDGAVELARALRDSPHIDFRGILTHAGQAYGSRSRADAAEVAAHERELMLRFADRLGRAAVQVEEISIGSTPGLTASSNLDGVTEVRPGNYIFFDAHQAAIGSCALDEVAFSVLGRVIGVHPDRHELVVNTGALALSKDPGAIHVDASCGFGVAVNPRDQRPIAGLRLASLSQEHGIIRSEGPLDSGWSPGDVVRILPNHSCLAAACFDRYHVVRGDEIVDEWRPFRGW